MMYVTGCHDVQHNNSGSCNVCLSVTEPFLFLDAWLTDLLEDEQKAIRADDGGARILHLIVKRNLGEDQRGKELSHHGCVHLCTVCCLTGLHREINTRHPLTLSHGQNKLMESMNCSIYMTHKNCH